MQVLIIVVMKIYGLRNVNTRTKLLQALNMYLWKLGNI